MVPLIHCDSNGALSNIRSTITSDKAKHIDVPFHNSRHLDAAGVVKFTEMDTLKNLADVMTKALPPEKHQYLTHGIGLHPPRLTALFSLTASVPRAHPVKRFLHLRGSDIHAETKV